MANVIRYLHKPADLQPHHIMKLWRARPKIFVKDLFDLSYDPWQEEFAERYMLHSRVAAVASKGPGKAQPLDIIIPTPKGNRKFGDLRTGDYVFGENGKPTRVTSIHPQGIKRNFKVSFDDGSSTFCCDEHLWKVRGITEKRHKTWSVKSLRDILDEGLTKNLGKAGDYYVWQIPKQSAVKYPKKNLPIDPYIMGLYLGDGSRTSCVISTQDNQIIEEIERRGHCAKVIRQDGRCPIVRVGGLFSAVRKLGFRKKYSYEKSIPGIFKNASVTQRIDLLRGLMDSDGTIDRRDGCCEFSTTSIKMAHDVQWLVRSLGGKSMEIKTKSSYIGETRYKDCYRVRVTVDFCPFLLNRKAKYWKAPKQDRYLCRTIKSVEEVDPCEMMCISVEDENRCYQTNDFIVTHNTFTLATLGWHFFITGHQPKMACLSITKDHLKSNLWAELRKLRAQSELITRSVNDGESRLSMIGHEGYSFIDARSYPKSADEKTQASALAGLHADHVAFLIDEAGSIPDAVINTADAALSTGSEGNKRARLLVTANPEVASGVIYRAYMGRSVQDWSVMTVTGDPEDPNRSTRVDIKWAKEQIAQYGREHPWVMINVLGKYPSVAMDTLLSEEEVRDASLRDVPFHEVQHIQTRLGVDAARGGADSITFSRRTGLKAYPIDCLPSTLRGPEVAGMISNRRIKDRIERVFVDDTGGYGSSIVDSLDVMPEIDCTPVKFNARAQEPTRYFNTRTEMYMRLRDWVRKGGQLPQDPLLMEELYSMKVFFNGSVARLEEKEMIKDRLGRSPDRADALALTFKDPDQPSFFADYGIDTDSWDDDEWQHYMDHTAIGNHSGTPNHIDRNSFMRYNHKA